MKKVLYVTLFLYAVSLHSQVIKSGEEHPAIILPNMNFGIDLSESELTISTAQHKKLSSLLNLDNDGLSMDTSGNCLVTFGRISWKSREGFLKTLLNENASSMLDFSGKIGYSISNLDKKLKSGTEKISNKKSIDNQPEYYRLIPYLIIGLQYNMLDYYNYNPNSQDIEFKENKLFQGLNFGAGLNLHFNNRTFIGLNYTLGRTSNLNRIESRKVAFTNAGLPETERHAFNNDEYAELGFQKISLDLMEKSKILKDYMIISNLNFNYIITSKPEYYPNTFNVGSSNTFFKTGSHFSFGVYLHLSMHEDDDNANFSFKSDNFTGIYRTGIFISYSLNPVFSSLN